MNLQEKYNEYKQRQEAKKFFNQNNDYHLSISDYIKMFVVGTVIAIFSTIAFDFISLQIGWSFSYFDILTGYFTGFIVLKIARYGSEYAIYLERCLHRYWHIMLFGVNLLLWWWLFN